MDDTGSKILEFIKEYIRQHGYSPSVREIGAGVGLRSSNTVHFHLRRLFEIGELETDAPGTARALRIPGYVFRREVNTWIPAEIPPETEDYVLLSFENFSIPLVGRYEEDENGGAYYIGDDDGSCISQDMIVNAWKPLPEPYRP